MFLAILEDEGLMKELESQEMSLLRKDFVEELGGEEQSEDNKQVALLLSQLYKSYPLFVSSQMIKQSAISAAIDLDVITGDAASGANNKEKDLNDDRANKEKKLMDKQS